MPTENLNALSRETEPLLSGSSTPVNDLLDPNEDDEPKVTQRWPFRLDMAPTNRDKLSLCLVGVGIALFLPLTWSLVLTGNVRAMGWFAPHPPLNSLAITAFILGITPVQPPTPPAATRAARLSSHQTILLGVALPAMALGTASMWWNKHVHGAAHFTTWHAWFGVATILWVVLQAAVGAGSVWFGGRAFGGGSKAKAVYKYHRLSGYILLLLTLSTAFLGGIYSTWAIGRGPAFVPVRVLAYLVGIPLILAGLALRVRPSKMKMF